MLALAKPKGVIKIAPADFVVKEVLRDGTVCEPNFVTSMLPRVAGTTHTAFLLSKREMGAAPACGEVARQLGVDRSQVTDHGRKDQFAVTAQMIVVEGGYTPHFQHEQIALRCLGPVDGPVRNGGHAGNRFSVLVQTDVMMPPEGDEFLNLFGVQRFGDGHYLVGKHLLEGDYSAALALMSRSQMNGGKLRKIAQRHGLTKMKAMLHPDFRSILDFKVLQWQSHLWNHLALQSRSGDAPTLPTWDEDHAAWYTHLWNPAQLNDEFVSSLHSFSRPLWVKAEQHCIIEEDEGIRHEFTLRSGAFATTFLGSLYELHDASRQGLVV